MSATLRARSHVGNAVKTAKKHPESATAADAVAQARGELAEAKIAAYIAKTVAAAPRLRPEQRERLAALLRDRSTT